MTTAATPQIVDQQIHPDRQRRNRDSRHQYGGRTFRQTTDVLAHQRSPIGIGRLHAEPEKTQPAQQQHDEHEAQTEIRKTMPYAMKGDAVVAALPQWRERIERMADKAPGKPISTPRSCTYTG